MAEDKRTKIGSTGPARETGSQSAVAPVPTPAPATAADVLPTAPPAASQAKTSYLPPQEDPLIGQTLVGRYLIHKKLGEGGMGAVYLATHQLLEKQVALKVLHGEFARKQDLVERFIQEAKAASRIRHENVIDISDFGTTPEGLVFFAMELLNGHDLHEEVARARLAQQLLPWERSKKIFLQICAALSAAHAKGIIHRDLKPENVYLVEFLGDPDFVKLLDFGIAKLTEVDEGGRKLTKTGMLFGTPEYMSPEQARGEPVDLRVDVYAMGCILFQLVTGRVPFEAENFMGVLSLHLTEPAPSIPLEVFDAISAPRELGDVIAQALLKDRNQRFSTIDDFANAVRIVCGDAPVTAGKTGMARAQRPTGPANIPAPSVTTERARTPTSPATPLTSTHNRVRTQWTGSLSVPTEDDDGTGAGAGAGAGTGSRAGSRAGRAGPRRTSGSKVGYLVAGGIVAAGIAIAVVVAMQSGSSATPTAAATTPSGGDPLAADPNAAAPVDAGAAAVEPPPPPPLPPPPAKVELRLASSPRGAKITDLSTGIVYNSPYKISRAGSHTPVQYKFTLRGYGDAVVELTPNIAKIEHTEKMERGVSGAAPTVKKLAPAGSDAAATSSTPPAGGSGIIQQPDVGSASVKPPDAGSATKPPLPDAGSTTKPPPEAPKHDPACDEIPPPAHCLKDPTRAKEGAGSAPAP